MGPPPRSGGAQEQSPVFGPCFFLSYAHTPRLFDDGDDPDGWVKQFYRDLCMELVHFDQRWHEYGPPGFMDDAMQNGTLWRRHLSERLASCRVFVPLYSRAYFRKEFCGREWALFRERQMAHLAQTGVPNEAIVPVLWQPLPGELPATAAEVQLAPLVDNTRYLERGLFELIRLDKRAYLEVVIRLAEHLDSVAREGAPPPGPVVDLSDVSPLFPQQQANVTPTRRLHITVAALDSLSLPPSRESGFYGRLPDEWNPYHPASDVPLLPRTEDLARELGYTPVINSLDRAHAEALGRIEAEPGGDSQAEADDPMDNPDGPGIILIDPWMAYDPVGAARIAELDRLRRPWVRAMVLWSRSDTQTLEHAAMLRAKLQLTMPRGMDSWRRTTRSATRDLGSLAELGHALPSVVEFAWNTFVKASRSDLPPRNVMPRPRLRISPPQRPRLHPGTSAPPVGGNS
ncbi:MAG TPA: TIR-like protein FxsC [Actinocrinis sp.]|uniref:TIR-like protein FxsC n=1 Tax=Actinocrinis sp. TaxID=1920516 RepID=UPI002DDDAC0C|nr:TIR-like protein FxsC [Actinocrinis sp.]HEV2343491.1 TIR-like protein FxsC [Actinocrinis sp.]